MFVTINKVFMSLSIKSLCLFYCMLGCTAGLTLGYLSYGLLGFVIGGGFGLISTLLVNKIIDNS